MKIQTINDQYISILKKCRFVTKPDEWFVEGSEPVLDFTCIYPDYTEKDKFNSADALFNGMSLVHPFAHGTPIEDGEICMLNEFLIYDENNNEISELTLAEYKELLKKTKKED
jgi:hypothetical protein